MAKKKIKLYFTSDNVDDEMYMGADLNIIQSPIKNGLEFQFEQQNGGITDFTLYHQGVLDLKNALEKWLDENK